MHCNLSFALTQKKQKVKADDRYAKKSFVATKQNNSPVDAVIPTLK